MRATSSMWNPGWPRRRDRGAAVLELERRGGEVAEAAADGAPFAFGASLTSTRRMLSAPGLSSARRLNRRLALHGIFAPVEVTSPYHQAPHLVIGEAPELFDAGQAYVAVPPSRRQQHRR